jgi:tetratricopeptide (TPR) repeat protein
MSPKKTAARSNRASRKKKSARGSEEAERYTKAVEAYERAVKTLHKGDLDRARTQFETITSNYPEETELADRCRAHLDVCERQLRKLKTFKPKDFESSVTYGVFLHNQGEFQGAVESLAKAVEMNPKSDHAHYCLAAAYARVGDNRGAVRHLKRAIGSDPYNRVLAITDNDFDSVRSDPTFAQILSEEEAPGPKP